MDKGKATAAEKKKALSDYEKHLKAVKDLKEMTDTASWREFHSRIQKQLAQHGRDVLDAEKTRDIIRHQEGVKILKEIIAEVCEPVTKLQGYVRDMPLFAKDFKDLAEWNTALGQVEMRARD